MRKCFDILEVCKLDEVNNAQKAIFDKQVTVSGGAKFIEEKIEAYLFRWKEALSYFSRPGVLLDIGGGFQHQKHFDLITAERQMQYHLVDIDAAVVSEAQRKLMAAGYLRDQAVRSDNTSLPFQDNKFDYVFSSHCLEHSVDLVRTFQEIRRVLRPRGTMFMSVPFGFDEAEEHNYYLGIDEWLAVVEASGFEVKSYVVSRCYLHYGWDISVVGQATTSPDWQRLERLTKQFCKSGKLLIHHTDPAFVFSDSEVVRGHGASLARLDARCRLRTREPLDALLLYRHPWSGVVEIKSSSGMRIIDAYSPVGWLSAVDISELKSPIDITVIARHPLAHDIQGGVFGALALPLL